MKAPEIELQARQYLEDHRELYFYALERTYKMGLIEPEDQETLRALLNLARYLTKPRPSTEQKSIRS
jgi:hypothetical protein